MAGNIDAFDTPMKMAVRGTVTRARGPLTGDNCPCCRMPTNKGVPGTQTLVNLQRVVLQRLACSMRIRTAAQGTQERATKLRRWEN